MFLEIYIQPTKRIMLLMFTQLKKTFNGTTVRGRANVAKATYGFIALLYLFMRFRRKKVAPITTDCQKNCPPCPGAEPREKDAAVLDAAGATAAAGVTAGAEAASASTAAGTNGAAPGAAKGAAAAKAAGKSLDSGKTGAGKNAATIGDEPRKPCKRIEPKDMSPLEGRA